MNTQPHHIALFFSFTRVIVLYFEDVFWAKLQIKLTFMVTWHYFNLQVKRNQTSDCYRVNGGVVVVE